MFVDVEHHKDRLVVDGEMKSYVLGNKEITPEVCLDILKSSNFRVNMQKMLGCIAKLPQEKQAMFKEIVLSTFDKREQPQSVEKIGRELAKNSGYSGELEVLVDEVKNPKDNMVVLSSGSKKEYVALMSSKYFRASEYKDLYVQNRIRFLNKELSDLYHLKLTAQNIEFLASEKVVIDCCRYDDCNMKFRDIKEIFMLHDMPNDVEIVDCDCVKCYKCDFERLNRLQVINAKKISFEDCENLFGHLNFERCETIYFDKCNIGNVQSINLGEDAKLCFYRCVGYNVDFSSCKRVDFTKCDMENIGNFMLKDGAEVRLSWCKNVKNIDLSMCNRVELSVINLANMKNMKFKQGVCVDISSCDNVPENLDLSMCDEVVLDRIDLGALKKLEFKEGAKVKICYCDNLPENIDFSKCEKVFLSQLDLANQQKLKFKDGADVVLQYCKNMYDVDVSMCDKLGFIEVDFANQKEVQVKESAEVLIERCENDIAIVRMRGEKSVKQVMPILGLGGKVDR